MNSRPWLPEPLAAALASLRAGRSIWLVGGAVRDALLGRPTSDYDLVVDRDAIGLARRVADSLGGDYYTLDAERDIGRVLLADAGPSPLTLDFSGLRAPDLATDLALRDFSVNAMAVDLADPGRLIDPAGGANDLRQGCLRACSPDAIAADPLRALRAVRLAAELSLTIQPETLRSVAQSRESLVSVAIERLRDELLLILSQPRPAGPLRVLDHLGLLTVLLPELAPLRGLEQPAPHVHDALDHTLAAVDGLSQVLLVLGRRHDQELAADFTLGLAAVELGRFRPALGDHLEGSLTPGRTVGQILVFSTLCHDLGKPASQSRDSDGRIHFNEHERRGADLAAARAQAMRLSAAEVDRVRATVANHMRPVWLAEQGKVTARAVHRFFRQAGAAGVDAALLSLGDFLGQAPPPAPQELWQRRLETVRRLFEGYFERPGEEISPPRLVRGDEIAASLGLSAGPKIGELLAQIAEAQAAGEVHTRAEALALAQRILAGEVAADGESG